MREEKYEWSTSWTQTYDGWVEAYDQLIETALEFTDFAEADAVIDYIKGLK